MVNSQPFIPVTSESFSSMHCTAIVVGYTVIVMGGHYVIYFLLFRGNNFNCEMGVKWFRYWERT